MPELVEKRCKRESSYDVEWYSDLDIANIKFYLEPTVLMAPIEDGWYGQIRNEEGKLLKVWYERSKNKFIRRWIRYTVTDLRTTVEEVWFKPRKTIHTKSMRAALDRYYKWVEGSCDCPSSNDPKKCKKKMGA